MPKQDAVHSSKSVVAQRALISFIYKKKINSAKPYVCSPKAVKKDKKFV
ncbi:Uncharacterised protein [Vibrio cholerae]|nr:Uncharacterised protein [Vibrio cholerae]CSC15432.1 Uncharacterised protein [Vibrio cholerae]CSD45220.1 Uncharacterised protein [Vibrio cholerae]CSI72032.1 Uncharacterised protein [Vibrio cholerae]